MNINFQAFVDSLPIIGFGMLGIFVVTGIIILTIYLIPMFEKWVIRPISNLLSKIRAKTGVAFKRNKASK